MDCNDLQSWWLCSQVLRPASGWAQRRWLLLACLGAVIMMGCLWADRALCSAFGSHVNFVHLLFLGCDIVFYRIPAALPRSQRTWRRRKEAALSVCLLGARLCVWLAGTHALPYVLLTTWH